MEEFEIDTKYLYSICGKNSKNQVTYIYLNILDGIQFLMKLFIVKMKLKLKMMKKYQLFLDQK